MGTLIDDINLSIRNAGGRMTLAHLIIEETPGWFTIEDKRFLKRRAYLAEAGRRRCAKRIKSTAHWQSEDVSFLLDKYGKMSIARLARILGRTTAATQAKFYRIASESIIQLLPYYKNGRGYK